VTYEIPSTPPANNQESYDRIIAYFSQLDAELAQEAGASVCSYRSATGRACAVGCQFPDSFYEEEWDNAFASFSALKNTSPKFAKFFANVDATFLSSAQKLHDNASSVPLFLANLKSQVRIRGDWDIKP
jgi:hypothetical protein